jgi:hypothetical protein
MFGVNVRRNTARSLCRCYDLQSKSRLTRAFRTVNLYYPSAWEATDADRGIEAQTIG